VSEGPFPRPPAPSQGQGQIPSLFSPSRLSVAGRLGLGLLLLALLFPGHLFADSSANSVAGALTSVPRFGEFPLFFELNRGQADPAVRFVARGRQHGIYLTSDGILLDLGTAPDTSGRNAAKPGQAALGSPQERLVRITFPGSNPAAALEGVEPAPGQINYLLGPNPAAWLQGVPTFARVRCQELYPGIDLLYYGNSRQLEFDFVLGPGANPEDVALRVEGADRLEMDRDGALILHIGGEQIRQHRPVAYQDINGVRRPVAARYLIRSGNTIGLSLGKFERRHPLTIDPILSYSTYFGGSKTDVGWTIAVDAAGSAYIAGDTRSIFKKIPPNGYQTNFGGGTKYGGDAFVAKFEPSGSNLVYLTYLGGSELESAQGIAVDNAGCAYITGYTDSTNFPVTANVFQPEIGGTNDLVFNVHPSDAFVTKLDASGSNLIYSTYLGGPGGDSGTDIAVDAAGFAYVVGYTESAVLYRTTVIACTNEVTGMITNVNCGPLVVTNRFPTNVATALTAGFPTLNPVQANNRGAFDAFVCKLAPDGSALVFSTYLGGDLSDFGTGVALDAAGNVAVSGWTTSSNLPVTNALQPLLGGGRDAFAAKLNSAGTSLAYLTYLGGTKDDQTYDVAMDPAGNTYVAGLTASTDFLSTPGGRLTGGVFRSVDGGGSWSLMSSGLTHTITHALWADTAVAGLVYAGTPRGVFKTLDGGLNWASANTGLRTLNVNALVADPSASSALWAGTTAGLFRSSDAGANWTNDTVNLGVPVVRALLFEPGNPSTFYAGASSGVYKSYDHGTNWAASNKGLKNKVVQALAAEASSPALLYAATAGGIFVSTNSGTNWKASNVGLSTKNTRTLVIDPSNPQILYAGTAKGLYKSTNAAANWALFTNGMGKPPINALLIDSASPTTLYAGTTNGIFKSLDAGANWAPSQANLTSRDVTALAFDAVSMATLYAGTRATNFAGGTNDVFLLKLVPNGQALAYAFTFGGSKNDEGWDLAVDPTGNAYVTGQTTSKNFPVANATSAGKSNLIGKIDVFVAEFDPTGTTNLFSIHLGGKGADFGHGIALDPMGGVYVVGRTESSGFTTTNALQPNISSDHHDTFVLKLSPGPSLSVRLAGENLLLQWRTDAGEYALEAFEPGLRRWAPVSQAPLIQAGTATVTLPAAANVRWFRLRQAGP